MYNDILICTKGLYCSKYVFFTTANSVQSKFLETNAVVVKRVHCIICIYLFIIFIYFLFYFIFFLAIQWKNCLEQCIFYRNSQACLIFKSCASPTSCLVVNPINIDNYAGARVTQWVKRWPVKVFTGLELVNRVHCKQPFIFILMTLLPFKRTYNGLDKLN